MRAGWTPYTSRQKSLRCNENTSFREFLRVLGKKIKRGAFFDIFQDRTTLRSAISFKRSRRELSIDVAEHKHILKNKGVVHILVVSRDRTMFKRIIHIGLRISCRGKRRHILKSKGVVRIAVIFQARSLFSHMIR